VNNARKHAKARSISIRMDYEEDWLKLIVEDDGVGMPEDRVPVNGIGLRAMHYRAKLIGAGIGYATGRSAEPPSNACFPGPAQWRNCD